MIKLFIPVTVIIISQSTSDGLDKVKSERLIGIFTFLMIIMELAEKEQKILLPIVTIQGN